MTRSSFRLACVGLLAASCGSNVRDPSGATEGGGGGTSAPAGVEVSVVSRGAPIAGIELLVHGPEGELLGRHVSANEPVFVEAAPGASIGAVWVDPTQPTPNEFWRLDLARVVTGMQEVTFEINTTPGGAENPPVRVEATFAAAQGVVNVQAFLPCTPIGTLTPAGEPLVIDAYAGCPGSGESALVVFGVDAEGQPLTFDHATFLMGAAPVVELSFPMTPISIDATLSMQWSSMASYEMFGRSLWVHDRLDLSGPPSAMLIGTSTASPATFDARVTPTSFGAWATIVEASKVPDPSDMYCETSTLVDFELADRAWTIDRLASPRFESSAAAWRLDASGERGDFVVITHPHEDVALRWFEPPPEGAEVKQLPSLELPADLPAPFTRVSLPLYDQSIEHQDTAGPVGYAEAAASGLGGHRPAPGSDIRAPYERRASRVCFGGGYF